MNPRNEHTVPKSDHHGKLSPVFVCVCVTRLFVPSLPLEAFRLETHPSLVTKMDKVIVLRETPLVRALHTRIRDKNASRHQV